MSLLIGLVTVPGMLFAFLMAFLALILVPAAALMASAGIVCAVLALRDAGRPRGLAWAGLLCNGVALVPASFYLFKLFL